ncbi:MAG: DUF3987 domain-containing protein [Desulfobacter sp.]|nr:MAG: DUF3987 domain-containing protein [Desulfobacter sp.]
MSEFQKERSVPPEVAERINQQVQDLMAAERREKEHQPNETSPHLYPVDQGIHCSDFRSKGGDQDTTKSPVIRRGHTVNEGGGTAGAGQPTTQAPTQVITIPDYHHQPRVPQQVDVYQSIKAATNEQRVINNYRSECERTEKNRMKDHDEYQMLQYENELARQGPIKIGDNISIPVSFPLHVLPELFQQLIVEVANSLSAPIEAVAPCLLGAIFIAVRGSSYVQIKKGYKELVTEYIAVAMGSGTNKTGIDGFFRNIFEMIEEALQAAHDKEAPKLKAKLVLLKKRKKQMEKDFLKEMEDVPEDELDEYLEICAGKLAPLEKEIATTIVCPRLLIDNPTHKALALYLQEQGGVGGLFEDEPAIWKDRVNARQDTIFLKGYNGKSYTDETSTGKSVRMPRTCFTAFSFFQTRVALDFFSKQGLKEDGLLPRILPVILPKFKGAQDPYAPTVSEALNTAYEDKIRSILKFSMPERSATDKRKTHIFNLTGEAFNIWADFKKKTNIKITEKDGEYKNCIEMASKLGGHAARLAAVVNLLEHDNPWEQPIGASAMNAGVAIAEFFAEHAKAIFNKEQLDAIGYANKILHWLELHPCRKFRPRKCYRDIGNKYTSEHCTIGLQLLAEHGYLVRYIDSNDREIVIVNPNHLHDVLNKKNKEAEGIRRPAPIPQGSPAQVYG